MGVVGRRGLFTLRLRYRAACPELVEGLRANGFYGAVRSRGSCVSERIRR
jgi:hypothetical protein